MESKLSHVLKDTGSDKLDAVVNVAGGWAGGILTDETLYKNVGVMLSQSVNTSVITARLAAKHLKELVSWSIHTGEILMMLM